MKISRLIRVLCAVIISSLFGALAEANAAPPSAPNLTESVALEVAGEWASLVSQADIAGLDRLFSDDFFHIHATARVESKREFLDAFEKGARRYDPITLEDATVRIFGDAAVVTGKFKLKAFARGKVIEGTNRFSLVLVKTNGGIQVVSFQATGIPPVPEAAISKQ